MADQPTPAPAPAQPAQPTPVVPVVVPAPVGPPTLKNVFRLAKMTIALEEHRIIGADQLDEVSSDCFDLTKADFANENEFAQVRQILIAAGKKKKARLGIQKESK